MKPSRIAILSLEVLPTRKPTSASATLVAFAVALLWAALTITQMPRAAYATDSIVCADDDNDGMLTKLKSSGLIDRDCDGEVDSSSGGGTDCDDTNPLIHNKSYVRVDATHYKYCNAGTYTSSTTATLGECAPNYNYYIDPGAGHNTNDCLSPTTACADFTKLSSGGTLAALGGANQTCIYLMGTADLTTSSGFLTTVSGPSQTSKNILARYPTSTAKINLGCTNSAPCTALNVQGDNWIIRGFEITGGYGGGIAVYGNDTEVVDNYIHDVQGDETQNVTGIYLAEGFNNALIHHNIVNNTFDPSRTLQVTGPTTSRENVYNINMYTGQGNIIEHNAVGYNHAPNTTPYAVQGGGIRLKHGLFVASVVTENQFRYNVVYNTENTGFDIGSAGLWVNDNLCVGSSHCVQIHDDHATGGSYSLYDIQVENNTCVPGVHVTGGGVTGGAIGLADSPGEVRTHGVIFTGNVVDDSATTSYGGDHVDLIDDFYYGSSSLYTQIVTGNVLGFGQNCYYNSNVSGLTGGFNVFSYAGGGSVVNFANWLSTYNMDAAGYNENVALDGNMAATSTNCSGFGWVRGWPGANIVGGCDFYRIGTAVNCF